MLTSILCDIYCLSNEWMTDHDVCSATALSTWLENAVMTDTPSAYIDICKQSVLKYYLYGSRVFDG